MQYLTIIVLISFLLLAIAIVFALYQFKAEQIRREAKLRASYEVKLAAVEMSALRAQMNPHFLFNSLNSIESFIIRNETRKASEYLSNFAHLIRLILQNSEGRLVNLRNELEALQLYMDMECLRFRNSFQHKIKIDESVDIDDIEIPPMLIQPYIENAIWHGLMGKKDDNKGKVTLAISRMNEENGSKLLCVIEDNGIGREKAQQIKTSRSDRIVRTRGMRISKDRIHMINQLYDSDTSVTVIDLYNAIGEACGTRVELHVPIGVSWNVYA